MLKNLQTILANLDRAIRNKETIDIGGGTFSGDELKSLREVIAEKIQDIQEEP